MKKYLLGALLLLTAVPAYAQQALVVDTCGTVPTTYTAGQTRPQTVDKNGKLCLSSTGPAGGDLSGTYPNPSLATSGVSAGTYGSASSALQITFDAKGRATAATSLTLTPAIGNVTGLGTGVATALGVNVGSAGAPVVNGGALGTPSSGVGTNLTSLNASNISSGTLPNARIVALPNANLANSTITISGKSTALGTSYSPARYGASPANPTGTSSTAGVMMGISGSITPATSGNILLFVTGQMFQSTCGDGCSATLRYGTGTAPANGAAPVGTSTASTSATLMLASQSVPFSLATYVTGLTISTAYWIDLSTAAITAGTCSLFNLSVAASEQ